MYASLIQRTRPMNLNGHILSPKTLGFLYYIRQVLHIYTCSKDVWCTKRKYNGPNKQRLPVGKGLKIVGSTNTAILKSHIIYVHCIGNTIILVLFYYLWSWGVSNNTVNPPLLGMQNMSKKSPKLCQQNLSKKSSKIIFNKSAKKISKDLSKNLSKNCLRISPFNFTYHSMWCLCVQERSASSQVLAILPRCPFWQYMIPKLTSSLYLQRYKELNQPLKKFWNFIIFFSTLSRPFYFVW